MPATASRHLAVIRIFTALAEAIKELKSVPSGHLYAHLMGKVDLHTYNSIIGKLQSIGLVTMGTTQVITWIGKPKPYMAERLTDDRWIIDGLPCASLDEALDVCEACDGLRGWSWDFPTRGEAKDGLTAMRIGETMPVSHPDEDEDEDGDGG